MREWLAKSFVGGNTVLDFLNTAGGDTKARDFERLESYSDVLGWALAADVINGKERKALAGIAEEIPDSATQCLHDLRVQRESLYRFITAFIDEKPIPESDRQRIERSFRMAFTHAQLVPSDVQPLKWLVGLEDTRLLLVQHRLALAGSTLVTDPVGSSIRQCERCSWLFLDFSATKRRRWCSMAVCGNRAKALRHYSKSRENRDTLED
jgi:predicted RNA-binding Zn ribbon-like protein